MIKTTYDHVTENLVYQFFLAALGFQIFFSLKYQPQSIQRVLFLRIFPGRFVLYLAVLSDKLVMT